MKDELPAHPSDTYLTRRDSDLRRASQAGLPMWLRVTHLARGLVDASGHAPVDNITERLTYVDEAGSRHEPHQKSIPRAIRKAVDRGLLHEGSTRFCLLPVGVKGIGEEAGECPVHGAVSAKME